MRESLWDMHVYGSRLLLDAGKQGRLGVLRLGRWN